MPQAPRAPKPYAALPLLWSVVMLVLTLTPAKDMPNTPNWNLLSFDTAGHAGVFAVLAASSWFSLRRQQRWPQLTHHTWAVVLLGCLLFGGLIEILQHAMNMGRHAEWTDLIGDTAGAALALLLVSNGYRWWQLRQGAALLLLVSLCLGTPAAYAQEPDLPRARRTIEALASPRMHGRGYVQSGEHLAAAYLRKRLRQLGLQPLAPNFTQPFELDVNTFPGKTEVGISYSKIGWGHPYNSYKFRPGIDFIAAPESGGTGVIFSGMGIQLDTLVFTEKTAQQLLQSTIRRIYTTFPNKPTLVLTAKQEERLKQLPVGIQQTLDSVSARIVLVPKLTASLASVQLATIRLEALATLPVWSHINLLHNGDAGFFLVQLDAQLQRHYQTQNLAAVVRGSTQPDSFLVVTAHYDHLGMMGKSTYFPGANDNASGVALLLELAAHYARPANQPAYSVVFLLFGAEEAGLVGSTYFAQYPLVPLSRLKFLVNLDLLGTGEEGATVVNGKVFVPAFQQLSALNDTHHYLLRLTARGAAANSDHYPFSQLGVPAFFLYTRGGSLAYHDVNDQPAALSLAGFAGAFGLVRDFLDGMGAGLAPNHR